jgi:conjugal transfer mating pair stabilization protein TraN
MKTHVLGLLLGIGFYHMVATGAPTDEAAAANSAVNAVGLGVLNGTDAAATVPGYTTTPPEKSYYGTTNLSTPTSARIAACTGSTDPICEATKGTIESAVAPRPSVGPYDPSIAAVRDIQNNPTATLGDLSGYYAGCTTKSVAEAAGTEKKMCARYVGEGNIRCANRLGVEGSLVESCSPGTYLPTTGGDSVYISAFGTHGNGESFRFAGVYVRPMCTSDTGTIQMRLTAVCTEEPCSGDTIITVDAKTGAVSPKDIPGFVGRSWYGTDYFNTLYYDGGGCVGDACKFKFHTADYRSKCVTDEFGTTTCTPAEVIRASATMAFERRHFDFVTTDAWDDQCALLSSTSGFGSCTMITAPVCVDGPSTKRIQGHDVSRACWQFDSTYNCSNGPPADECAPLVAAGCVQTATACKEATPGNPLVCGIYQDTYECGKGATTTTTVTACPTSTFCVGAACFDTSSPKDADFARTVAYLEAGREAGKYIDPKTLKVFKGADNRCDQKLFGITNCCKAGGSGSGSLSNAQVMYSAGSEVGSAAFSTYTYDSLFASDAPDWVVNGFEALFSGGTDSVLAGMMAGDLTVESFLEYLIPGPWTFIMLAIQLSGLLDCEQQEQITAMKKDAGLCHEVGSYCSEDVLGVCLVETHTNCCFNSKLALIINEQARVQLGKSWGSAEGPDCSGFTIAELQSLDFSKMDLSAFYADVLPKTPSVGGVITSQGARLPDCYYGQGKCK